MMSMMTYPRHHCMSLVGGSVLMPQLITTPREASIVLICYYNTSLMMTMMIILFFSLGSKNVIFCAVFFLVMENYTCVSLSYPFCLLVNYVVRCNTSVFEVMQVKVLL